MSLFSIKYLAFRKTNAAILASTVYPPTEVAQTPRWILPFFTDVGMISEKYVSPKSNTCGGKIFDFFLPNNHLIWLSEFFTVAVDAIIFGLIPSRSHNASIAVSYKPTSVPNGPEIKCSSSCIINSGGGSDVFMLITFHSGFVWLHFSFIGVVDGLNPCCLQYWLTLPNIEQ